MYESYTYRCADTNRSACRIKSSLNQLKKGGLNSFKRLNNNYTVYGAVSNGKNKYYLFLKLYLSKITSLYFKSKSYSINYKAPYDDNDMLSKQIKTKLKNLKKMNLREITIKKAKLGWDQINLLKYIAVNKL